MIIGWLERLAKDGGRTETYRDEGTDWVMAKRIGRIQLIDDGTVDTVICAYGIVHRYHVNYARQWRNEHGILDFTKFVREHKQDWKDEWAYEHEMEGRIVT